MMDKSFIEKIESLALEAGGKVIKDEMGKEYTPIKMERLYDDPRPSILKIQSLSGILDYLKANVDMLDLSKLMLHIVNHERVDLISYIHGESNERHTVMQANRDGKDFPFEKWIEQEEFIILVRSLFLETNDRADILHHTAKINTDSAITTADDGVKQNIQVKKGLSGALTEAAELKPIVRLKPCRTFSEVDQPESDFLFRMKGGDGGRVYCALFEADNADWKNTARKSIGEFLKPSDVTIIA